MSDIIKLWVALVFVGIGSIVLPTIVYVLTIAAYAVGGPAAGGLVAIVVIALMLAVIVVLVERQGT